MMKSGSRLLVADFPEFVGSNGLPYIINATMSILDGVTPTQIDMVLSHSHYDHIGGAKQFFIWAKRKVSNG